MKLSLSLFLVLLIVIGFGWSLFVSALFEPPASYLLAFLGGIIIGSVGMTYWLRHLS